MKIEKKQLKKQLREIEFLFSQSAKGLHHLFDDKARIANILSAPAREKNFFNSRNMKKIQNIFAELVSRKTVQDKKNYLSQLNSENFEILVRTYFHIVDNTILSSDKALH